MPRAWLLAKKVLKLPKRSSSINNNNSNKKNKNKQQLQSITARILWIALGSLHNVDIFGDKTHTYNNIDFLFVSIRVHTYMRVYEYE